MPSRPASVEMDPEALTESLQRLERRVAALEQALAVTAVPAQASAPPVPFGHLGATLPPPVAAAGDRVAGEDEWTTMALVTLSGRTLVALGGAYLLRALTEGAVFPPAVGVTCGGVYAIVWLALCARGGALASGPSAVFHGLTAALIAYPLVWETTARFALVPPAAGAVMLAAFTALMFLAARRTRLEIVAWFGALAGTATAVVLAVTMVAFEPFTVAIALIGVSALWLGYLYEWVGIRWPVAAAANLMVLAVTFRALAPEVPQALGLTIALQLFVLVLYLGSFVVRTLVLRREVVPFEMAQSAAVMAVGFGGALAVLAESGSSALPLGLAALLFGAATYAFAFVYVEPQRQWRNLTFFTSLAVAFSLAGVLVVLPAGPAAVVLGGLALGCAEWARRSLRVTLAVHALVFATGMAWLSGLLGAAAFALGAPASTAWAPLDAGMFLALGVLATTIAWQHDAVSRLDTAGVRILRLARLALLVWVAAGTAIALAVMLLPPAPAGGLDAAAVATIRTVALAAAAVLVLRPGRCHWHSERAWLAYALLAVTGLKLLAEDLPRGRPATLFIALAVYGAALIIVPKVARGDRQQTP